MRSADLALLLLEPQAHGEREQREGETEQEQSEDRERRASPVSVDRRRDRCAAPLLTARASARRPTRSHDRALDRRWRPGASDVGQRHPRGVARSIGELDVDQSRGRRRPPPPLGDVAQRDVAHVGGSARRIEDDPLDLVRVGCAAQATRPSPGEQSEPAATIATPEASGADSATACSRSERRRGSA